jgi:hypothetical protein
MGRTVRSPASIRELGDALEQLKAHFLTAKVQIGNREGIVAHIDRTIWDSWYRVLRDSIRGGNPLAFVHLRRFMPPRSMSATLLSDALFSLAVGGVRAIERRLRGQPNLGPASPSCPEVAVDVDGPETREVAGETTFIGRILRRAGLPAWIVPAAENHGAKILRLQAERRSSDLVAEPDGSPTRP